MKEKASLAAMEPVFRAILDGGGVFTLRPRGDSMRPTIVPGRDSVSIVKWDGQVSLYDILFYKRADGNFVLHRVLGIDKDGFTMCGDNQVVLEHGVQVEQVIGIVTEIIRPQGTLARGTRDFVSPGLRRAKNRPLRIIYGKLRRLLGK
ncbi:MAG: S24/S26 family peptidase [Clostridia bacterium]|nr:S24/S26 family peptidase [Clostridia bacterium]